MDFKDSPDGLIIYIELIAGVPPMGYDPYNIKNGNPMAGTVNDLVIGQLLESVRNTPDWDGQFDALTRHMIEEFGNLQFFVPELYKKYAPMGGITHIPSIGNWIQTWNLTVVDLPTINYYNELRGLIEALPQVDISKTLVGQKIVSTGQKVGQVFTWGPVSAMHAPATPEAIKRNPQFDAVVSIRDKARETVDTVRALIDVVVEGGDGDDSDNGTDDDPLSLETMIEQARDRVTQVTDGIGMLEQLIGAGIDDVADTVTLDKAEKIAKDIEQKANQLDVTEKTILALIKTQQKYGPGVVPIPKVLQPLFRPLAEIFNFPEQQEPVTPKTLTTADARVALYTAENAASKKLPTNVQLTSAGRAKSADVPGVVGSSKVAASVYKTASGSTTGSKSASGGQGPSASRSASAPAAATTYSSVKPSSTKPADAGSAKAPAALVPAPAAVATAVPSTPTPKTAAQMSNTQTAAAAMAAALLAAGRAAYTPQASPAAAKSSITQTPVPAGGANSLGSLTMSGNSMQLGPLSIKFSMDKDGKPLVPIGLTLHGGNAATPQG